MAWRMILGRPLAKRASSRSEELNMMVDCQIVLLAGGVSVGIGVLFGVNPANCATKIRPIDALRFE